MTERGLQQRSARLVRECIEFPSKKGRIIRKPEPMGG